MRNEENYSLKAHNTFGIDAKCRRYLEYCSVAEAQEVAAILRAEPSTPYIIIGGGSNLLLTRDFCGTVVRSSIRGRSTAGRLLPQGRKKESLTVGSGESWDALVDHSIAQGRYGLENLSLIPGDVGAAAVQNIGAYGAEAKDYIESVEAVEIATGDIVTLRGSDCGYGYRQSHFKQAWKNRYLITHVTFRLSAHFEPRLDYGNLRTELERRGITAPTARQLREVIIGIRRAKLPDPEVMGNAGSFFMNPVLCRPHYEVLAARYEGMPHYDVDPGHVKVPAGWLIEQCGWKGRSMGRAGVHDKQALVLVNLGGATGAEIVALSDAIRRDVNQKFGIEIRPEVNIV